MALRDECGGAWTLLAGHRHVLVEIARDPEARTRDIASRSATMVCTLRSVSPARPGTSSGPGQQRINRSQAEGPATSGWR
jgi:hypothetical protein